MIVLKQIQHLKLTLDTFKKFLKLGDHLEPPDFSEHEESIVQTHGGDRLRTEYTELLPELKKGGRR